MREAPGPSAIVVPCNLPALPKRKCKHGMTRRGYREGHPRD